MSRFTLEPRQWYAMNYTFPSGELHVSPIYCQEARPKHSGQGWLKLVFFHANYAEGVQDKAYDLRVIARAPGYLLALRENGAAPCVVLITALTHDWLRRHFAFLYANQPEDLTPPGIMQRHFPHV